MIKLTRGKITSSQTKDQTLHIVGIDGTLTDKKASAYVIGTVAPHFRTRIITIPSGTKIEVHSSEASQQILFGGSGMILLSYDSNRIYEFVNGDYCTIPGGIAYEIGAAYGYEDLVIILIDVP